MNSRLGSLCIHGTRLRCRLESGEVVGNSVKGAGEERAGGPGLMPEFKFSEGAVRLRDCSAGNIP